MVSSGVPNIFQSQVNGESLNALGYFCHSILTVLRHFKAISSVCSMIAALKSFKLMPKSPRCKDRSFSQITLSLFVCVIAATISASALASPLSTATFNGIAASCGVGVEASTLRAVASVESHFDPLAIRDNTTGEALTPQNLEIAISVAKARLAKGHSVDLGLMQINSANLASFRLTISNAFDACHSLTAARDILLSAMAAGSSETQREAVMLISLSRYNTGRPLAGVANGYANRVIAAQSAVPTGILNLKSERTSQWDIWGDDHAAPSSWIRTANGPSETKRAGAQTSDARNEGRASASQGEPYEVFAYQENEPIRP
jgi:type IV secretion system protein VirB1